MDDGGIKLLHRGSIVKIKNYEPKYMIVDNLVVNDGINYEYSAVSYPMGVISFDNLFYFNASDIEEVYFMGNVNRF